MIEETITQLLEEKFSEPEWSDCFVIDIVAVSKNRLHVFIDSDENLTTAKCSGISRFLEKHIEEQGLMGEKYTLQVSSPGLDRPLKFPRQFKKNIGRLVRVSLFDTTHIKGELTEVDEETITIDPSKAKGRKKKKKKKKDEEEPVEIPFDDIEKCIVEISFK